MQLASMGTVWESFAVALGLHGGGIMVMFCEVMLWLCYGYVMAVATAAESAGERLCYGCHASQERINLSAVPMIPESSSFPAHALCTLGSVNSEI